MQRHSRIIANWVGVLVFVAGCATIPENRPKTLSQAQSPAWSLKARQDEMVIAVSPAGKVLRLAGSSGLVIGAVIDANVNAKYARTVGELLTDYDTAAVFEERVATRLGDVLEKEPRRIAPMGSMAGFRNQREAEQARLDSLSKQGIDVLLDLAVTYGLYGPEGTLAAKLTGQMILLPEKKTLWRNKIVVASGPVLANAKLGDPTDLIKPDVSSGLTVDEEAMKAWSSDDGTILRSRFEEVVDAAVSALLCDLGLHDEPLGRYSLGRLAMNRRKFQDAERHFAEALAAHPDWPDALNACAANLGWSGNVPAAIEAAKRITERFPDYGPAWFNLAWWYAIETKNPQEAARCYEKARALGIASDKRIEKIILKQE